MKTIISTVLLALCASLFAETRQATGVKIGEVTESSAMIWVRQTQNANRKEGEVPKTLPAGSKLDGLSGYCPGAPGQVRVRYAENEDLANARETAWVDVTDKTDCSHAFKIENLKPATEYHFLTETAGPGGKPLYDGLKGRFKTAPTSNVRVDVNFVAVSCQAYRSLDDPAGHLIYESMLKVAPRFFIHTGDMVYYDHDEPDAMDKSQARYHWQRLYSLPRLVEFHRQMASYFEKDDHDAYQNDYSPGAKPKFSESRLTAEDGVQTFYDYNPIGETHYRTFRWGKLLQIWLTDGRDFRSSNNSPDGPDKTVWGKEQKEWFKKTVLESDADWKLLVSPTPLVGPDKGKKGDNHANNAFRTEGEELREWIKSNGNGRLFIICGDRHWQYHSVDPKTGVQEFCTGAVSDQHSQGSPGLNKEYHKFHLSKGGFLEVSVKDLGDQSTIRFIHRDVNGKVVYEWSPGN